MAAGKAASSFFFHISRERCHFRSTIWIFVKIILKNIISFKPLFHYDYKKRKSRFFIRHVPITIIHDNFDVISRDNSNF